MKQLQPVLWTRGVLLAPQHLQTQDRFLEDCMQFRLSALTYCRWGFQRLEIDEEALATGEVRLLSAAGIFPDGLLSTFRRPTARHRRGRSAMPGSPTTRRCSSIWPCRSTG